MWKRHETKNGKIVLEKDSKTLIYGFKDSHSRFVADEIVTKRKARMNHQCNECLRLILKGKEYYEDKFIDEFGYYSGTSKICEGCWKYIRLHATPQRP